VSYHRDHWKKWAYAVGEFVPGVYEAVVVVGEAERLARPQMAYQNGGHPLIAQGAWQFPGPPANMMRVNDFVQRIGGALAVAAGAPGAGGRADMVEQLLHSVPPAELDAIIRTIGPAGIGALNLLVSAAEQAGAWTFYHTQDFINFLLENVSPYLLGLLGVHLGLCQPTIEEPWEEGGQDGWIQPAGPFVVFDDKKYRTDGGYRVEASTAPMAWQDMLQGAVADCWFLTSTQAVVKANPAFMSRHVWANPNGSVSAVFYDRDTHQPQRMTVAPDLPVRDWKLWGASGHTKDPAYAELWPGYYEKAFAQSRGGYEKINYGWGYEALPLITGRPIESLDPQSPNLAMEIHDRLSRGCAVVSATVGDGSLNTVRLNGRLVGGHAYFVKDVDVQGRRICIGNPWGDNSTRSQWECWLTPAEAWEHLQEVSVVLP
jgi:hypothetical protein